MRLHDQSPQHADGAVQQVLPHDDHAAGVNQRGTGLDITDRELTGAELSERMRDEFKRLLNLRSGHRHE